MPALRATTASLPQLSHAVPFLFHILDHPTSSPDLFECQGTVARHEWVAVVVVEVEGGRGGADEGKTSAEQSLDTGHGEVRPNPPSKSPFSSWGTAPEEEGGGMGLGSSRVRDGSPVTARVPFGPGELASSLA